MVGNPGTAPLAMIPERLVATNLRFRLIQSVFFQNKQATDCMASERVTPISSLVGEVVFEPLLTGVAASPVLILVNALSMLVI
jgi:hypothetical protein